MYLFQRHKLQSCITLIAPN
uniref:Uncharacterized protein n=1 Tax=Arundo donax TaxID=35708 RepID=A0A0A9U816_ARUDO